MIRILLVDDQNIVWQGLQALFKNRPQLEMVGYATNGKDALQQVAIHHPDIVLIDIEMPQMNGIIATQKICQQFPQTRVIIFSSHEDPIYAIQSLQAGARGYLLKQTLFEDLEKAICLVYHGFSQVESQLLEKIIAKTSPPRLVASKQNRTIVQNNMSVAKASSESEKDAMPEKLSANNLKRTFDRNNHSVNKKNHNSLSYQKSKNTLFLGGNTYTQTSNAEEKPVIKKSLSNIAPSQESLNTNSSATNKANKHLVSQARPKKVFGKFKTWSIVGSIATIILATMGVTWIRWFDLRSSQSTSVETSIPASAPAIETISGLGRIEPQGKAISLSAPTSLEAAKVEKLLVEEGDRVKQGQIIAILDGRERQLAVIEEAKTQVEVAQARLEQVKAGAKRGAILAKQAAIANLQEELAGEIQTKQATIAQLTAELDNAGREFQRYQQLYEQRAISASELDSKSLVLKTARERLNEAKANLDRTQRTLKARLQEALANLEETTEVRSVDIQIAQAQLRQAEAAVARAESDLELAYIRAPIDGEILAIHARSGEALGEKGIAQLGQTNRMMVVAEIDRHDIDRVKIGQQATIFSGIFDEQLQGRVHQIGFLIGKNDILNTDPAAKEDTRVVEVEILLAPQDSKRVAKLTNLEVDVTIKL